MAKTTAMDSINDPPIPLSHPAGDHCPAPRCCKAEALTKATVTELEAAYDLALKRLIAECHPDEIAAELERRKAK